MARIGGTGGSNSKMYFLASQMQQFAGWGLQNTDDPIVHLVSLSNPALTAGSHLEMDLPGIPPSSPTATLLKKVWKATREALSMNDTMKFTPLWNNFNYPELDKLQGFSFWRQQGIWFFNQLYSGSTLKAYNYNKACEEFSLTHKQFHQYLQLRHALQT